MLITLILRTGPFIYQNLEFISFIRKIIEANY